MSPVYVISYWAYFIDMHNKLISERFFTGTITSVDATTYVVQVAPHGAFDLQLLQGVPLVSQMSKIFGFKDCLLPSVGSRVLCYRNDFFNCIIIGVIPDKDDYFQYPLRTIVGAGDGLNDKQNAQGYVDNSGTKTYLLNANRPTDVVEGERVLMNEFGVSLSLFQQLAQLKGSDLAQVQAFVLDDLVRIISHNFQHFTALGEYRLFHDGKDLQIEIGLTHNPTEAQGTAQISEVVKADNITEIGTVKIDDSEDFYKVSDEQLIGIERLKCFIGSISNFINIMLVRPAEGQKRSLNGTAIDTYDKGIANLQVGLDGRVHLNSLAGLSLEKTNWIRVPHRIRAPEDPTGDREIEQVPTTPFTFDDTYKYENQPFLYFLQIRDYLSYTYDGQAYSRFKTLTKDFDVNDDFSNETQLVGSQNIDPNNKVTYLAKTSGVYIMPNGGLMFRDAWGSAIVMEGGNIYIQPAKDLVMQPMRHMVAKVGSNVSVAAKNDIDFSSTIGGVRVKADKSLYFYSDNSGILLHSNAQGSSEPFPNDGSAPISIFGGVILNAPNSGVFTYAQNKYDRIIDSLSINVDNAFSVATGAMYLESDDSLFINSSGGVYVGSQDTLLLTSQGSTVLFGEAGTAVGLESQTYGVAEFGLGKLPVQGLLKTDAVTRYMEVISQLASIDVTEFTPVFKEDTTFIEIAFQYPESSSYQLVTGQDVIPQTIAQQEEDVFNIHSFGNWEEKAINNTYPFPGLDFSDTFLGATLNNLAKTNNELHNNPINQTANVVLAAPTNLFKVYKVYGS